LEKTKKLLAVTQIHGAERHLSPNSYAADTNKVLRRAACIGHIKIGTLSVHVFAHGDCTVTKGFNQYSVACKNIKRLMFK
jgi:hypothetical protein